MVGYTNPDLEFTKKKPKQMRHRCHAQRLVVQRTEMILRGEPCFQFGNQPFADGRNPNQLLLRCFPALTMVRDKHECTLTDGSQQHRHLGASAYSFEVSCKTKATFRMGAQSSHMKVQSSSTGVQYSSTGVQSSMGAQL